MPIFLQFVYIAAALTQAKGTMGKYDPDMGGVGMGSRISRGVPVGLWACDATLVLWCLFFTF